MEICNPLLSRGLPDSIDHGTHEVSAPAGGVTHPTLGNQGKLEGVDREQLDDCERMRAE